jgi:hypothetical protein
MMDLLLFVICALATYRLSLMFSKELGPCRIFERIRGLFKPDGCWYKGISCIFCETVWWAGLISFWMMLVGAVNWQFILIYWLGMSGLAVLITKLGPDLD